MKIVDYPHFETSIMVLIMLNSILLMLGEQTFSSDSVNRGLALVETIFSYIFAVEVALKLLAYRRLVFRDPWNIFDFLLVAGSLSLRFVPGRDNSKDPRGDHSSSSARDSSDSTVSLLFVMRIFRVLRLCRLIKKAKWINAIFNSFWHTIPTFINVFSLIILLIYLFAVIGNKYFAEVKISGTLDHRVNFKQIDNSLLTFIQVMTGEGWYRTMKDLLKNKSIDYDCKQEAFDYQEYKKNGY